MAVVKSADSVRVIGLDQFRKEVKKIVTEGGDTGQKLLGEANERVADYVIRHAVAKAAGMGKLERKAASSMTASKSGVSARILAGGAKVPFFGGAEFGADRDTRRLIKAPVIRSNGTRTTVKRSRATKVRDGEDIGKVARRVESQSVDTRGRTISPRLGGQNVALARTNSGGLRVIKGWNQFRTWRGNSRGRAGYFLFPTMRDKYDEIGEMYLDELDRVSKKIFPD
jgi:hypothetical protein